MRILFNPSSEIRYFIFATLQYTFSTGLVLGLDQNTVQRVFAWLWEGDYYWRNVLRIDSSSHTIGYMAWATDQVKPPSWTEGHLWASWILMVQSLFSWGELFVSISSEYNYVVIITIMLCLAEFKPKSSGRPVRCSHEAAIIPFLVYYSRNDRCFV